MSSSQTDTQIEQPTAVTIETNRWNTPTAISWGAVTFGFLTLALVTVTALIKGQMSSAWPIIATLGVLAPLGLWIMVFKMPQSVVKGRVDDSGIHGHLLFGKPIDIAWSDIREARVATTPGTPASLSIKLQDRSRYQLWGSAQRLTPTIAAAVAQLHDNGITVIETP